MSAPTGSGALARDVGLSDAGKERLAEIRARNALVVALNNESWGTKLTPLQQRAFAEYMRRFRLDIAEVDNLGGRPYRNGRYYMRRFAELAEQGRIDWIRAEHIGPDSRVEELAATGDEWGVAEHTRRLRERIRLAVPVEATHAYLVTVKLKALELPLEGVKWYVPGRQKQGWAKGKQGVREMVSADPVGDENPVTSIETRAWRRVGRLAAAGIPELREQEVAMNAAEGLTADAVRAEAELAEQRDQAATIRPHPLSTDSAEPYALTSGPMKAVETPAAATRIPVAPGSVNDHAEADRGAALEYIDDSDLAD